MTSESERMAFEHGMVYGALQAMYGTDGNELMGRPFRCTINWVRDAPNAEMVEDMRHYYKQMAVQYGLCSAFVRADERPN